MRTVYLAGPIAGCAEDEAKNWRTEAANFLIQFKIKGVTPLRNEPAKNGQYVTAAASSSLSDFERKGIPAKNLFDVRMCDMILVYLPKFSYGTVLEIGWGYALNKSIVMVTEDEGAWNHPCMHECVGWKHKTLDEGLATVVQILGPYA